jgi:hypothetical protein
MCSPLLPFNMRNDDLIRLQHIVSKSPTIFPIPTFSPRKSSTTSKPLVNNSTNPRGSRHRVDFTEASFNSILGVCVDVAA